MQNEKRQGTKPPGRGNSRRRRPSPAARAVARVSATLEPPRAPAPASAPAPSAPLTAANLAKHQRQFREVCQFGCAPCGNRTWWKSVAAPKFVSRCKICRTRYEAIPVEERFGYGIFECPCGHKWTNNKAKGNLEQDCKKCGRMVTAKEIRPPPPRLGSRRSNNRHSCEGCATGACRFKFVASRRHDSTGSTLSTATSVLTLASVEGCDVDDVNEALTRLSRELNGSK